MVSTPTIARPLVRHPLEASEMLQSNNRNPTEKALAATRLHGYG